MEQKILNISFKRDINRLLNNEVGVLTSIEIDELLHDGTLRPYRRFCSYTIRKNTIKDITGKKNNKKVNLEGRLS